MPIKNMEIEEMQLVLLARHTIGLNILKFLLADHPDDVSAVVSTTKDPVYDLARQSGLPVFIYSDSEKLVRELRDHGIEPTLGAMVWWPFIIKEPLISFPENGFINTHPALLPFCRGSMSNFWALVDECPFGATIHQVDSEIDHGDIITQTSIPVGWEDTDETLYHSSLAELENLFRRIYPAVRTGQYPRIKQNPLEGSYHAISEMESATEIALDIPITPRMLLNKLRARSYKKTPGCRFFDENDCYEVRVEIKKVPSQSVQKT